MKNKEATDLVLILHNLMRNIKPSPGTLGLIDGNRIAPRHVQVLIHLGEHGQLSVSEIAQRLGVNLTTASLSVAQLAQAGFVERNEDPEDHRRTIVKIADHYRHISERIVNEKITPLQRSLTSMGPKKANLLIELLEELDSTLSTQPEHIQNDR